MKYFLKLVIPPQLEPVTAELARLHSHISHTAEDLLIELWISAARDLAEQYQRRAYVTQVWEMSFDRFPVMPLSLPHPPLQNVVSVRYFDKENTEHTMDLSQFIVDTDGEPGRICFNDGYQWPTAHLRQINSVKIRYTAGYDNEGVLVPANVVHAILLYCTFHDQNRAAELDKVPAGFYNLLTSDRVFI
jgi:uncharacterized phiE125 gp8 family phage protein